jgi:hypothetical protein
MKRTCITFAPVALLCVGLLSGCTHRVAVEAPREPITINLNVKIEHEIRVKVDEELDELFAENEEIF